MQINEKAHSLAAIYAQIRFRKYLDEGGDPVDDAAFEFLLSCFCDAYRKYASKEAQAVFESLPTGSL